MGFSGTEWLLIAAGFVAGALLGLCLFSYAKDAARALQSARQQAQRSKATRPARSVSEDGALHPKRASRVRI